MTGFGTPFAGQRFAVMGLGRNGLPAARALVAMGADVIAWDDKLRDAPGLELRDPTSDIARFDALVLSPGIPHRLPSAHPIAAAAVIAGVPILSDAELLYRAVRATGSRARFAGITGTNGKSTTTSLLAHILMTAGIAEAAGGNLGTAALALPWMPDGVYVLEMSSYMLERLAALRFDAAAMLNLSPDHLDRHGDMAGYADAKRRVFDRQDAADTAVVGIDDGPSRAMADLLPGCTTISGHAPADIWCDRGLVRDRHGPIVAMADCPALPGAHNAQNAAAAAALALALGATRTDVQMGVASFAGLPHRQQLVTTIDGVAFVNDSKATNADAAARALACYDPIVWIAGGVAKAGGIEALAPLFPRIAHALLIGQDAPLLAATLRQAGVAHTIAHTLDEAVPAAHRTARRSRATVLLSPACASFDQFSGFEARGERFRVLATSLRHAA